MKLRLSALLFFTLFLDAAALRAQGELNLPDQNKGPTLAELETKLREQAQDIVASTATFDAAIQRTESLELSPDEAKAAHAGQLDNLPDSKKQALQDIEPLVKGYEAKLKVYFDTYDLHGIREMDTKSVETYTSLRDTYGELQARLTHRQLSKLEKYLKDMGEQIVEYWKWRETTNGPDGYKRLVALRKMSQTTRLAEQEITRLKLKVGDLPKPSFWQSIGASLGKAKRLWMNLRTKTALIPPSLKLFAYLGFNRKPDQERMSELLKEMGERFGVRAKIDLTICGTDRIPQGKRIIFAPSHRSTFVDSLTMVRVLPGRVTPTMTLSFFPTWFQPIAQRMTKDEPGIIFANAQGVNVVDQVADAVRNNRTVLFFPEGTVPSPLGEVRPLRSGLLYISEKLLDENLAVVPVTIKDPFDAWGEIPYASGDRPLGMKLGIHYERPINARAIHALSHGESERLLLDLIRCQWHRRLEPEFQAMRDQEPARQVDEYSCEVDGENEKFELLHAED